MAAKSKEIRNAGLKVTLPRVKILEILESSRTHHLSAEDVYKILLADGEEIGLATVYRVLTQFATSGLVIKHNFEGAQSVYEIDRGGHHDHMICIDSGKVIEFFSEELEQLQRDIVSRHGFVLEDHSLVLYVRPKSKSAK